MHHNAKTNTLKIRVEKFRTFTPYFDFLPTPGYLIPYEFEIQRDFKRRHIGNSNATHSYLYQGSDNASSTLGTQSEAAT